MAYELLLPSRTLVGKGAVEKALPIWKKLGTKAMLVTDSSMVKLGNAGLVKSLLEDEGVEVTLYAEITGEPDDKMIEAGLQRYEEAGCEHLIGLGGGSALDAMKAIGVLVSNGGSICDYNGRKIENPAPHMSAIPTTAGTGSEATRFTVINDTVHKIKMLLSGEVLLPELAVIDPRFTLSLPPEITASTGMDAFTHAVEAYTSKKATALSDTFALSAFQRIVRYLPAAYEDGGNEKAREEMAIAAFEAGIAFSNASVTLVHGLSRPIGALFHVPHGIANAMLAETCFAYAFDGAAERFARLAGVAGAAGREDGIQAAADKFLNVVNGLCKTCRIPTLAEYGINHDEFHRSIEKMARDAWDSGSTQNTRKELTKEDIMKIYRSLR